MAAILSRVMIKFSSLASLLTPQKAVSSEFYVSETWVLFFLPYTL
jgi:hypothetical protein